VSTLGYFAVLWSAGMRGYQPGQLVSARNVAFAVPVMAAFFWLTRKERYRGEMLMLTAAVFLFAFGSLMQFRLFSDPEYGARGGERTAARKAKAQTVRLLNIRTGYDDEKKKFLFGNADSVPERAADADQAAIHYTIGELLTSVNTYIPLLAILAMAVAFRLFKSEAVLLWLQRHSIVIGLAALIPFSIVVLVFSEEGKFLGQTTPWEGVKILFLVSFAGLLADTYRHLRRTRWGLPPTRYLVPFAAIAAMPVVPFFALSDFGQMLVFLGVYTILYVIAVRHKAQLMYGLAVVALLFGMFYVGSSAATGFGVPNRVAFRFYQWLHTWEPPPPDAWWWKRDYDRYVRLKNLGPEHEIGEVNREAWFDKVLQQSQGLFGVNEGGVVGQGLGLGFPETVPVSDSDFIYAAAAEETGLVGALAVLLAVGALVFAGLTVSLTARDMYTKLLAAGFSCFVGLQAVVNVAGVLRVLPMTGITLPFVSHGGASLITSFGMLGVLLALSHRNSVGAKPGPAPAGFVAVK
jgi:cell division protein FtsW (lipid II flippase)